ncbi:MAG: hypothetical protein LBU89_12530 [Fibromonadaceae bacterium]|jgi:hypothetical protein|nr:hypothetical protein [Fibromonadaceae bacterium]
MAENQNLQAQEVTRKIKTGYGKIAQGPNSFGFNELKGAYKDDSIREIADNTQGKADGLPVAVPSPFALLDLPRAAFKNAYTYITYAKDPAISAPASGYVVASREDFRLVRHVLDMAELFIECASQLNFIEINQSNIDNLLYSENERHLNLGKTLETFKQMDKKFGFVGGNNGFKIYLVEYNGKIIGGTSKETMFFVSRSYDDLRDVRITVGGEERELFSDKFANYDCNYKRTEFLEEIKDEFRKRGEKFKKWIVGKLDGDNVTPIGLYINELNGLFGDDRIVAAREPAIKITSLNGVKTADPAQIALSDNGYEYILIDLKDQCVNVERITDIEKLQEVKERLVNLARIREEQKLELQNRLKDIDIDDLKEELRKLEYEVGIAETKFLRNKINNSEISDVNRSMLLQWLENGRDFAEIEVKLNELESNKTIFEDFLIKIPYKSSGNFKVLEIAGETYLYPIKKSKVEYYVNSKTDPKITVAKISDNLIKIIIDGVEKCYAKEHPDPRTEQGLIIETAFALRLFPFIGGAKEYRVLLIEDLAKKKADNLDSSLFISFYASNKNDIFETDYHQKSNMKTSYLMLKPEMPSSPIAINLSAKYKDKEFNIYVPPNFGNRTYTQGDKDYSFAIDFGTTNTHIEFLIGKFNSIDTSVKTFESFSLKDHVATLLDLDNVREVTRNNSPLISSAIQNEFLPFNIEEKHFPFRTLLLKNGNNKGFNVNCIGKYAIPLQYKENLARGKIFSSLKWVDPDGDRTEDDTIYEHFLREIVFLLHAKVLLTDGNLKTTKIYYSSPLAFEDDKRLSIKSFWRKQYEEFFEGDNNNIKEIPESIAPLKYFLGSKKINIEKGQPTLCIDIGGGSTDSVVITRDENDINKIVFHTSFKFAGNDIFGGTLTDPSDVHYSFLTEKYSKIYGKKEIKDNSDKLGLLYSSDNNGEIYGSPIYGDKLNKIYEGEEFNGNVSGEVNSYLFSLEDLLKSKGHSYMERLKDNKNIRIVFLYFFSSIIYNLAKMLQKSWKSTSSIPFITNVIFSGNGSKILDILGQEKLKPVIKNIFECVYGRTMSAEDEKNLEICFYPNETKVLTAKGCLIPSEDKDIGINPDGDEKKVFEDCNRDEILTEIDAFNKCFAKIISQDIIMKSFRFPKGQKEKFEELTKDFKFSKHLTRNEDQLSLRSFEPLHLFILKLFKEFLEWKETEKVKLV